MTEVHNDGVTLSVALRGVSFSGRDFDGLEPEPECAPELLTAFTLCAGSLCACTLECQIPVPVIFDAETLTGILEMHLEIGPAGLSGCPDDEVLRLSLDVADECYHSRGSSGWFEDELLTLQTALPSGACLKACISCAWSDYSPYGHGLFGGMACFRKVKQDYSQVKDKYDLFPILDKADRVQETYVCPEFERRLPGTGYRG